jgi:hypothetical protein
MAALPILLGKASFKTGILLDIMPIDLTFTVL